MFGRSRSLSRYCNKDHPSLVSKQAGLSRAMAQAGLHEGLDSNPTSESMSATS